MTADTTSAVKPAAAFTRTGGAPSARRKMKSLYPTWFFCRRWSCTSCSSLVPTLASFYFA